MTDDYVHFSNDFGPYTAFVRFHAGWPVSSADPKAPPLRAYEPDLPLAIVKRHGAGLIALVGDSGFAMNKNLEREDGSPIEGMRENAFFWRWMLDLLEHEEETWIPPAVQADGTLTDPLDEMLKSLQIPELKVDPAAPPPAGDSEALPNEEKVKGPVLINPDAKSTGKPAEPTTEPTSDPAKVGRGNENLAGDRARWPRRGCLASRTISRRICWFGGCWSFSVLRLWSTSHRAIGQLEAAVAAVALAAGLVLGLLPFDLQLRRIRLICSAGLIALGLGVRISAQKNHVVSAAAQLVHYRGAGSFVRSGLPCLVMK